MKMSWMLGGVLLVAVGAEANLEGLRVEEAPADLYEKLEIKNGEAVSIPREEAEAAVVETVDGFQQQVDASDAETRTAILEMRKRIQEVDTEQSNVREGE